MIATVFHSMTDFNNSPFSVVRQEIPPDAKVIFVADAFANELTGGAELTSQALIDASPLKIHKVHSHEVDIGLLERGKGLHWIFGNFARMDLRLIPTIVANLSYSVLEYDYKYCRHRSPEKHMALEGVPCDCHNQQVGKMVSAFYLGAKTLWWMSEAQRDRYITLFPFLSDCEQVVLSSVFSQETLERLKDLRRQETPGERAVWLVLDSQSWIKGTKQSEAWCLEHGKPYATVGNVTYDEMLKLLTAAKGLVYLPPGGDTCPRLVIEAKLLGCELHLNDNVQHRHEAWFDTDDLESIEDYLASAPTLFWRGIAAAINLRPKISGYTTTRDCVKQQYPFKQCIESMLGFCDQVVVVDGGSTDGTWEILSGMQLVHPALVIVRNEVDLSHPRFALFDGMLKAQARALCTGDVCWQMDCDEVVHEDDYDKVQRLAANLPRGVDCVSLPVIEYWGGPEKVRADIQPWKWRLSRNLPHITHGVPAKLRRLDILGTPYAAAGTDGCDMIDARTYGPIEHVSFYTGDVDAARLRGLAGDAASLTSYEAWFNAAVRGLPCVFHYSWYDLPRKIRTYRDYWARHWKSLYDQDLPDTAENNYMFDVPWSRVTEGMIEERAAQMKSLLGGWIWHRKWDGVTQTPHIKCHRTQPGVMLKNLANQ